MSVPPILFHSQQIGMTRLQTQPDEKIDFGDRLFLEILATGGH